MSKIEGVEDSSAGEKKNKGWLEGAEKRKKKIPSTLSKIA